MQSFGSSLRRVGVSTSSSRLAQPGASSHVVLWNARRNASFKSPLAWLRESLSLGVREKHSAEELAAARKEQAEKGQGSIFDSLDVAKEGKEDSLTTASADGKKGLSMAEAIRQSKKTWTEHKYSTANFKISHRKLNQLGRQIAGQPIDMAILQMMFSEKRASKRIKSMLVVAKDHAKNKGLEERKLIVAQSWVTKGPHVIKRIEPRGRGHMGVRQHPDSRLNVLLKEGKTKAELAEAERKRKLKRIVSSGLVREDVPLRNVGPAWAW